MNEVWPSKRQSSVILILVCAPAAGASASSKTKNAVLITLRSSGMPTARSRSCAGAELVGERRARMRRIAQQAQRRARHVIERHKKIFWQLERQRELGEQAVAQRAHRRLVGEHLLAKTRQTGPLVVAEAADLLLRPRVPVGQLPRDVEALVPVGRRLLGVRIL